MNRAVRVNSPKHKILEALSSTNKTAVELAKITGQTHSDCLVMIEDLISIGFISKEQGVYTITMFGVDEYGLLGKVKVIQQKKGSKAGTRDFAPRGDLKDVYNLNLSRLTCRDGALDFLNHPSVYGGVRKERK